MYKLKLFFILSLIILSICSYGQSGVFKVTLDAGHGGKDTGATYYGRLESVIALDLVLKVGKILENYKTIKVNYTRKTDVFIELVERANIANRFNSNIFVSLHCNANKNVEAHGTETYVMGKSKIDSNLDVVIKENSAIKMEDNFKGTYDGYDPSLPKTMGGVKLVQELYSDGSLKLAVNVVNQFKNLDRKVRGVKEAPFMVLHKAYMPRVLIEVRFISNKQESDYMVSESGQDEIANSIANAIISYKNEYFGSDAEIDNFLSISKPHTLPEDFNVQIPSKEVLASPPNPTLSIKKEDEVQNIKPVVLLPPVINHTPMQEDTFKNNDQYHDVNYQIQFFATTKKRSLNSSSFKKIPDVIEEFDGNLYKYSSGLTNTYSKSKKTLEYLKSNGFPSAFMNVYKNGKKFSPQEVQNLITSKKNTTKEYVQKEVPKSNKNELVKEVEPKEVLNDAIEHPKDKPVVGVVFKIQLLASRILRDTHIFTSKGLNGVEISFENNFYKYLYGATSDYNTSIEYLNEAKLKGYPEAFLIAYKEGIKVNPLDYIK